jgi:hypothetical protein
MAVTLLMKNDKMRSKSASSSFSDTGIALSYLKEATAVSIEISEIKTDKVP